MKRLLLLILMAATTQGVAASEQQRRAVFEVSFTVTAACAIDSQAAPALTCTTGTPYRIVHASTASTPVAKAAAAKPALVSGDTIYF
jgi:hypothetical protein